MNVISYLPISKRRCIYEKKFGKRNEKNLPEIVHLFQTDRERQRFDIVVHALRPYFAESIVMNHVMSLMRQLAVVHGLDQVLIMLNQKLVAQHQLSSSSDLKNQFQIKYSRIFDSKVKSHTLML